MRYLLPLLFLLAGCSAPRQERSPYLVAASSQQPQALPSPPPREALPPQDPPPTHERRGTRTIFIDPGHGGHDRGTASPNKRLLEKSLNLETCRRVERLLTAKGYRVFMSRRKDVFVPLHERVQMAAKRHANIFVSIHFNFTKNSVIQGAEIFYFSNAKQPVRTKLSRLLGTSILKRLTESLSTPSRGVKTGDLCVIRETSMPSVLVEPAFLSNPTDARLLLDPSYRSKIAQAIAGGIEDYFRNRKEVVSSEKASPARIERAACRLGGDRSIH